mmetsp:Transcript_8924/g.19441  ORF Transcript_8924/g.19441 Transcript_8924/m.19441 type:complete len:249 (-) Transcript_8924:99-845(-)
MLTRSLPRGRFEESSSESPSWLFELAAELSWACAVEPDLVEPTDGSPPESESASLLLPLSFSPLLPPSLPLLMLPLLLLAPSLPLLVLPPSLPFLLLPLLPLFGSLLPLLSLLLTFSLPNLELSSSKRSLLRLLAPLELRTVDRSSVVALVDLAPWALALDALSSERDRRSEVDLDRSRPNWSLLEPAFELALEVRSIRWSSSTPSRSKMPRSCTHSFAMLKQDGPQRCLKPYARSCFTKKGIRLCLK